MSNNRNATKHEYNKPQLKQQIDAAMAAFVQQGRHVQHVPTVVVQEPMLSPAMLASVSTPPAANAAKGAKVADPSSKTARKSRAPG